MSEPTGNPDPASEQVSAASESVVSEQGAAEGKAPPRHVPIAELVEERTRRKALQAQLEEIEKSKLSDLERAQAEAAEAKGLAAKANAEALRYRIAAKHQISDEDAELFLLGADEETLTKQAERLVARAPSTPGTPKPDLSQGGRGSKPTSTADAFAAAVESALH